MEGTNGSMKGVDCQDNGQLGVACFQSSLQFVFIFLKNSKGFTLS
jgi:hypothetical protein